MTPEDIVWEPYSPSAIAIRAPLGISLVCTQDQGLWMTTAALVYDVAVQAHCPDRVMRQFGQRQSFPVRSALDRGVGSCSAPRSYVTKTYKSPCTNNVSLISI